jgi:hypothetical protein
MILVAQFLLAMNPYHDFPILLRVWFVALGAGFLAFGWLVRGPWYWKRTTIRIPKWLSRTSLTAMGVTAILVGIFGHVSH